MQPAVGALCNARITALIIALQFTAETADDCFCGGGVGMGNVLRLFLAAEARDPDDCRHPKALRSHFVFLA